MNNLKARTQQALREGNGSERHVVVLTRAQLRLLFEEGSLFSEIYLGTIEDAVNRQMLPGAFPPSLQQAYEQDLSAQLETVLAEARRCTKCGEHLAVLCSGCHHRGLAELHARPKTPVLPPTSPAAYGNNYGLHQDQMG
jgi:hypothetical protein